MTEEQKKAAVSPEDVLYPNGEESGLTDAISIDFALIPDYARNELAATTLESIRSFLRQPGGREILDAGIAKKKERVYQSQKRKEQNNENRQNSFRACN